MIRIVKKPRSRSAGGPTYTYLLDDVTGSAAAYALRLQRSLYGGSAVRVRRASDNAEQDIGFVDNVLDLASLASFCSGTEGFVPKWYGQSTVGNDAAQATAGNQPLIFTAGSVIVDGKGKPAIQFDGSSDLFDLIYYDLGAALAYWVVLNVTNVDANRGILAYMKTSVEFTNLATDALRIWPDIDLQNQDITSGWSAGDDAVLGMEMASSNLLVRWNGATIHDAAAPAVDTGNTYRRLGRDHASRFLGTMGEVTFFSGDKSGDRGTIESNLDSYYGYF